MIPLSRHAVSAMLNRRVTGMLFGAFVGASLLSNSPYTTLAASPSAVQAAPNTSNCSPSSVNYNAGYTPNAIAIGDVNGDGKLDLAAANHQSNTVSIALGNDSGGFQPTTTSYGVGSYPQFVALKDINKDGKLDMAVVNDGSGTISVFLGTGAGNFGVRTNYAVGLSPRALALGDFNGDSYLDMAVSNHDSDTVSVLLGTGSGSFGAATSYAAGVTPMRLSVGDINNDGKLDLAVSNAGANNVSVLLGTGTGAFSPKTSYPASVPGYGATDVATKDVNSDGNADLLVTIGGGNSVNVFLGNGSGGFATPTSYPVGSNAISVDVGDLDGDNILDVVVANWYGNSVSVLKGKGDGTFLVGPTYPAAGGQANSATLADLNGDGILDVTVANYTYSSVTVILGPLLDLTAPTGSLQINQGASVTVTPNITLNLSAQDVGCGIANMAFSNDGTTFTPFENYAATKVWSLPVGDGLKTVFVVFKDLVGNTSQPLSATITLNQTLPTSPTGTTVTPTTATPTTATPTTPVATSPTGTTATPTTATPTTPVATSPTGTTATPTTATPTTPAATSPTGTQTTPTTATPTTPAATSPTGTLTTPTTVTPTTPVATSTTATPSTPTTTLPTAMPSPTLPTNEYGVTINDGALFTKQVSVTLTLGARPGTTEMQISNDGGFGGAQWEPYALHKPWQITQYGTYVLPRVVYVRFKDVNGGIWGAYQDDILLDVTAPHGRAWIVKGGTLVTAAAGQPVLHLEASDDVSGVAGMRFSATQDFEGVAWMPFAASYAWDFSANPAVYVEFRDGSGNISQAYAAQINAQVQVFLPLLQR